MIKGKNIISIVDIGSTKITCLIVRRINTDNYKVLGMSQTITKGIKSGIVINLELAKNSITQSLEIAENMASVTVRNVFVSINSSLLISEKSSENIALSNQEVTVQDLNKLLSKALGKFSKQEEVEIIHTFSYEYVLDGNQGILYPLGLCGNQITGFFHIISAPTNYIANIAKCFELCQLKIDGYISSGYAAGLACLKNEEMDFGCAVIEINGLSSTVSLFLNNTMIFTDGIPYGGITITKDIAKVFNLDMVAAEQIKNTYGSVMKLDDENCSPPVNVSIQTLDEEECLISNNELNDVIQARMYEIIILLKKKLQNDELIKLCNRIVVTGGCAQSVGIKELTEEVFKLKTRIGMPNNQSGIPKDFLKSAFSVPIGMLQCIERNYHKKDLLEEKKSLIQSTWEWIKENF